MLQQECDRELALVEDLLVLQHIEAGTYTFQPIPINLEDFITHVVKTLEVAVQKQEQTIVVDLAPNLPMVNLDSLVLHRILTELLSNACKYSPPGETISISVRTAQLDVGRGLPLYP